MRKTSRDMLTADLFDVPKAASTNAGSLDCRKQIAAIMSDVLKGYDGDRYEVAAKMSRLLGRDVTKPMLDAYTAESRETHIPPIDTAIAFDIATGGIALLNFFSDMLGCRVMVGKEVLLTELGRISQEKKDLSALEKEIQRRLGTV